MKRSVVFVLSVVVGMAGLELVGLGGFAAGASPMAVFRRETAARQVLIEPRIVEASRTFGQQLGVEWAPPRLSTNPVSFGTLGPVLSAGGPNGLLLAHEQLGVQRSAPSTNPTATTTPGDRLELLVGFSETHAGALAVQRAFETTLGTEGFQALHDSQLTSQGIAGFGRAQPTGTSASQILSGVYANTWLAVSENGAFSAPPLQSIPLLGRLFAKVDAALRSDSRLVLLVTPRITTRDGAKAYLSAVDPVNAIEPTFEQKIQGWNAATTAGQASIDANPLLQAFNSNETKLLKIASGYAPARMELLHVVGAIEVMKADLSELPTITNTARDAWVSRYHTDLSDLTAASNRARAQLHLAAP